MAAETRNQAHYEVHMEQSYLAVESADLVEGDVTWAIIKLQDFFIRDGFQTPVYRRNKPSGLP